MLVYKLHPVSCAKLNWLSIMGMLGLSAKGEMMTELITAVLVGGAHGTAIHYALFDGETGQCLGQQPGRRHGDSKDEWERSIGRRTGERRKA